MTAEVSTLSHSELSSRGRIAIATSTPATMARIWRSCRLPPRSEAIRGRPACRTDTLGLPSVIGREGELAVALEPKQEQGGDDEGCGGAKRRDRFDQRRHRFDDADQHAASQG